MNRKDRAAIEIKQKSRAIHSVINPKMGLELKFL